ncbi:MAG: choice-of-anchor tandem repeat GloVer-containing protein [Terriglobales bacterium]
MNNPTQHRSWILGTRRRVAGAALALAIMLVAAVLPTGSAQAQTYSVSVLHSFTGPPDGAAPHADVVEDAQGNLYGTTGYGGDSACNAPYGCGTAFKLDASGNETVLHAFTGPPDGSSPLAEGLVLDAQGNLYGTTYGGGASNDGTVFKLDTATGAETVLHSFTGSPDGSSPESGGLTRDAKGNLYGATKQGGANGYGIVFKVDASGNESVLYSFTTGGSGPGNLVSVLDAQGNLYGITFIGGDLTCNAPNGCGTVFKLDTAGNMTVLYAFTGSGGDGANPGKLVLDAQDNLYGGTEYGGDLSCNSPNGCGTVYKLAPPVPPSVPWTETVLYSFTGGADGYSSGGLMLDAQDNLYGGTEYGGDLSCNSPNGCGTVFKLAPPVPPSVPWTETTLYTFTNEADGFEAEGGLLDTHDNLYVTEEEGGDLSCTTGPGGHGQTLIGCGTVFKLTPAPCRMYGREGSCRLPH